LLKTIGLIDRMEHVFLSKLAVGISFAQNEKDSCETLLFNLSGR